MERVNDERWYRCPDCLDRGWIVTSDDDEAPAMKPCLQCRPILYRRWRDGHFTLNHHCDECAEIRAGRVTRHDYLADGTYVGGY